MTLAMRRYLFGVRGDFTLTLAQQDLVLRWRQDADSLTPEQQREAAELYRPVEQAISLKGRMP